MPTTLTEWQKHLEQHFAALAQSRIGTPYPLFALEHGLTADDLRTIKELLRARITNNEWLKLHWLVWVVYATEFGYEYFGDEYWQSFEEFTPYWKERGKREWLREWFKRFHDMYNGIEPTGKWALACKNIAWPITHAILPRYLQDQFAKALYELRNQLAHLEDVSPRTIGEYLRDNAWNASSRFRQFLQQEDLTGRLTLALLFHRDIESESPVYGPALKRLIADLEAAQSAKEWLKETQRVVGLRMQGARTNSTVAATQRPMTTRSAREQLTFSLRPRLILRPNGAGAWSVLIEIPSLTPLASAFPELRAFLMTTRCNIAGTWSPAGTLINGPNKRVVLKGWPLGDGVLLKFEKQNARLQEIIDSGLRLSVGPNRLFAIGADGCGAEIIGKVAHPSKSYLVLSENNAPPLTSAVKRLTVDCTGVALSAVTLPATTTIEHDRLAQGCGFQISRTVRVWPAGLPPKRWDGEGESEWLTTDSPTFGLKHDYAEVRSYIITLNGGSAVRIDPVANQPTFISLVPLPAGQHVLTVRPVLAYTAADLATEGRITLAIREPQPWIPGTTQHSGLLVILDPPNPSLDDLLDGALSAAIHGPAGRTVTCTLELFNKDRTTDPRTLTYSFKLPVTPNEFARSLLGGLQSEEVAWQAQASPKGRLCLDGEELGRFEVPLDREYQPVRCVCRERQGAMVLRVLEDNPEETPVITSIRSFHQPASEQALPLSPDNGYVLPPPGGLVVVRKNEFISTIVASSSHVHGGLKGLVVQPDLREFRYEAGGNALSLELLTLWRDARLVGPLAEIRRARVVNAMLAVLYQAYCGDRWFDGESALASRPTPQQLDALQRLVGGTPAFAGTLRKESFSAPDSSQARKDWFAKLAKHCGVREEPELSHFALQFASQPEFLTKPFLQPVLSTLLDDIRRHGILMRGARFAAILASLDNAHAEGVLLPRWTW